MKTSTARGAGGGIVASLVTALLFTVAAPAQAIITSVTENIQKVAPPASVQMGDLESDTTIFAFDEQQNVTLGSDLCLDITEDGLVNEKSDLTPGSVPAGTPISSQMLHADREVNDGSRISLKGTITVDRDILGVIVGPDCLRESDAKVGAPGTLYPTPDQRAGSLEWTPPHNVDLVQVEMLGRTVRVRLRVGPHFDRVRVITSAAPFRGCTPGYWKQSHHFDSWVKYTPSNKFETVFGIDTFSGDPTLLQVLKQGGGGVKALGRHAVAALLNATSSGVHYQFTEAQVISMVKNAIATKKYEATKNTLEAANERACPIN